MTLCKADSDTFVPRGAATDWTVQCDEPNCPAVLDCPDRTFSQVIQFLKVKGWRAHKGTGGWLHRCPNCLGKDSAS